STPGPARAVCRTAGTPPSRMPRGSAARRPRRSAGKRSRLFLPAVGLRALLLLRRRGGARPCAVCRVLGGLPATRAEAGVGRQRMAAVRARDDCLFTHWTAAVRTEVRAPDDRRAALAAAGSRTSPGRGSRKHRVELVEPRLEIGDVPGVLAEQVLPELLPAVHLHRQAAEVAEQLLAGLQNRAPLPPERAGRARAANRGGRCGVGLLRAALPPMAPGQGKSRHEADCSSGFGRPWPLEPWPLELVWL